MKILLLAFMFLFLSGYYMVNKSSTLEEPPFAMVEMKGTPTEAAACVGRYWQSQIGEGKDLSDSWRFSQLSQPSPQ